ncbi:MAG: endolytic transglycosylase MltG [Synergistaceae bacterium]|jgi:UPF0755 protein|nr:endolytic transglycosylase MltG [Synergistaceae bacterium]
MKKRGLFCILLLFFLSFLTVALALFLMRTPYEFWNALLPIPHDEMRVVVIKPGLSARECADAFKEQDALTGSASSLAGWMRWLGIDRKIRPGQYRVIRSSPWDLARQLTTLRPVDWSLTIAPGMDVFSIKTLFDFDDSDDAPDALFLAVMNDANYPRPMTKVLPSDEEGRIAFLLPETYFVVERTPVELVKVASHAWWDRFGDRASAMTSRDLSGKAAIASMIEREALWDEERPIIAGVINNRLKKNMPLQIDATVVYAWKLLGKRITRVLYSDLEVDSPYNTYAAPGLPPSPICVPSAESWEAALSPGENGYYYYVARRDGYHIFAETYDDHRKNIKKAKEN